MKSKSKVINDLRNDYLSRGVTSGELTEWIAADLKRNKGLEVAISISSSLPKDQTFYPRLTDELLELVIPHQEESSLRRALPLAKRLSTSKTALNAASAFNAEISTNVFTVEENRFRKALSAVTGDATAFHTEVHSEVAALNRRLRAYKFTDIHQFKNDLADLIPINVPSINKRITIRRRTWDEINFDLKEFLKLSALYSALLLFLEKRISDWVILKIGAGFAFLYLFAVLANEFFEVTVEDLPPNSPTVEVMRLKAHFAKYYINLTY